MRDGIEENRMPYEYRQKILRRIGGNIKRLQQRDELTLYEMEQRTGIGHTTIWHWEAGYCVPPLDKVLWLCGKLGWRLSEIIGGAKDG